MHIKSYMNKKKKHIFFVTRNISLEPELITLFHNTRRLLCSKRVPNKCYEICLHNDILHTTTAKIEIRV